MQAASQQRLKRVRALYTEKVAIRKELLAEHRGRVWPINLAPDPDGRFALSLALKEESAARTEFMRLLRIFNELIREGTLPDEEPGLFLVSGEMDRQLYRLSAMNDEEDQETPFQEMDAQQLTGKTAWVRLFVREASERGYTIEDIAALLHEPGMTAKHSSGFCLQKTRIDRICRPERMTRYPEAVKGLKLPETPVADIYLIASDSLQWVVVLVFSYGLALLLINGIGLDISAKRLPPFYASWLSFHFLPISRTANVRRNSSPR